MPFPDLRLDETQRAAVARTMIEARDLPSHAYPWEGLAEDLLHRGVPGIAVIGYGSLLNSESAAQTLSPGSLAARRPVVAFGVRRLFTRAMLLGPSRYRPSNPHERGALNVRVTRKPEDVVNGVVIALAPDDVPALRRREQGYDLVPVACVEWSRPDAPAFTAYVLASPEALWNAELAVSLAIEPHPDYYQVCRRGAAEFGDAFLRLWLATTYLADGVTPVSVWERDRFGARQESDGPQPA